MFTIICGFCTYCGDGLHDGGPVDQAEQPAGNGGGDQMQLQKEGQLQYVMVAEVGWFKYLYSIFLIEIY